LIVFGKCFPVVFNDETLFFENGVVWCRRLCHKDSGAKTKPLALRHFILLQFSCDIFVARRLHF